MGDSKGGKAFGDQWLGSLWRFKILFKKAIAVFSLSSEAVSENVKNIPSESGIGRKGWFHFPLVCGQYKIWAIMAILASLNLLSKSPLHWEGSISFCNLVLLNHSQMLLMGLLKPSQAFLMLGLCASHAFGGKGANESYLPSINTFSFFTPTCFTISRGAWAHFSRR